MDKKPNEQEQLEISTAVYRAFALQGSATGNLRALISQEINRLITHDFNLLVTTLYRLDISEKNLQIVLHRIPTKMQVISLRTLYWKGNLKSSEVVSNSKTMIRLLMTINGDHLILQNEPDRSKDQGTEKSVHKSAEGII